MGRDCLTVCQNSKRKGKGTEGNRIYPVLSKSPPLGMVHKLREKRSRIKNRCTNIPDYPRDIWHFISRSGERVINTKTGNLLKDVLDAQSLSQSDTTKIQRELQFPKTIQKAIDLEQLQQRSVSANPEKEAAARLRAQRWAELEAAPQQTEKRSGGKTISDRRREKTFDIDIRKDFAK